MRIDVLLEQVRLADDHTPFRMQLLVRRVSQVQYYRAAAVGAALDVHAPALGSSPSLHTKVGRDRLDRTIRAASLSHAHTHASQVLRLLLAAPIDCVLTELRPAFNLAPPSQEKARNDIIEDEGRQADVGLARTADPADKPLDPEVEANTSTASIRSQSPSSLARDLSGGDAGMEARLAARAAEIDRLIAEVSARPAETGIIGTSDAAVSAGSSAAASESNVSPAADPVPVHNEGADAGGHAQGTTVATPHVSLTSVTGGNKIATGTGSSVFASAPDLGSREADFTSSHDMGDVDFQPPLEASPSTHAPSRLGAPLSDTNLPVLDPRVVSGPGRAALPLSLVQALVLDRGVRDAVVAAAFASPPREWAGEARALESKPAVRALA